MGANFITIELPGALPHKAVEEAFEKAQRDDRYENGHSYSGGLGMASGIKFPPPERPPFADGDVAEQFLQETAQKWEEALAVKYQGKNGEVFWLIGAWCAS